MVRGLPQIDHVDQICDSCLVGKQRRTPFPEQAKYRAKHVLDLVHGDLCGPITPATPGGKKYFLLLVDDLSRYMWLVLLTTKDEASVAIKHFQTSVEVETGRKLRALRTDRGGEFTSVEFGEYCADRGVQRHLTTPYSLVGLETSRAEPGSARLAQARLWTRLGSARLGLGTSQEEGSARLEVRLELAR